MHKVCAGGVKMKSSMNHAIQSALAIKGYVFLERFRPDATTIEIAAEVGEPMIPWEGGLVQKLVPRGSSTPNTYSGIYGFRGFPFHTDLAHWQTPPRYLLLRCINGYQDVPTLVIDGQDLIKDIGPDLLSRAIFKPRRPQAGTVNLLRLCDSGEEGYRLRWDEVFLKPASKVGEIANEQLRHWLADCSPTSASLASPFDTLLLDNWRMLHARSPILPGREDRDIERIYLRAIN